MELCTRDSRALPHWCLVFGAFAPFWGQLAWCGTENSWELYCTKHNAVMGLPPSTEPKGRELGEAARHCKKAEAE